MPRLALGVAYRGSAYQGWQSQSHGLTVQDKLESALSRFADRPVHTLCAGRTDTGVHARQQVVHFDTDVVREPFSWVRGTNAYLPADIAVQWAAVVDTSFHARACAVSRRYVYTLLSAPVRPALEHGLVGWTHRPLSESSMAAAVQNWLGEHDFSAFRSSQCQSHTPVKTLQSITIQQRSGPLPESVVWFFEFEANAFLHHMVRNMMGMLVMIGSGAKPASWALEVLESRRREWAAPTFAPDGLTFLGPVYGQPWAAQLPVLDRHFVGLN